MALETSRVSADSIFRARVIQILAVETAMLLAFFAAFVNFQPTWLRAVLGFLSLVAVVVAVAFQAGRFRVSSHVPGRVLILIAVATVGFGLFVVSSPSIAVIGTLSLLGLSISAVALDEDVPGIVLAVVGNTVALSVLVFRSDEPVAAMIAYLGVAVTATFLIVRLRRFLFEARDDALRLARVDPLTGLLNRRGIELLVASVQSFAERTDKRLGCLVLDLDYFKTINDKYGHRVGDGILIRTGTIIQDSIRDMDLAARTGGEEFLIFAAVAGRVELAALAERIRISVGKASDPVVTVSIGAALRTSGQPLSSLYDDADAQLYLAKAAGRNMTRMHTQSEEA